MRWVGVAAALVAAVLAWPAGEPAQTATSAATGKSGSANWQPWDPAAVAKLNAEGKPVFVDFTAAWCVSCQANKRLVLTRAEIEQASQVQSIVQAEYLSGVINRSGADGRRQLMPILDFQRLVEDQFSALQRATTGSLGGGERAFREEAADKAAEGADELRLVSFTVAGQEYGIDIAEVREIVQVPEHITGVPNTAHHVLGLISLRERLLPLVSLRSLFGLPTLDADESHRIVVVAVPGGGQVGLLTDAVKEVLTLQHTEAEPVPAVLAGVDDVINSRPPGGQGSFGRDYYVGAQLMFNDEDLKSLLAVGGSAMGNALK